MIFPEHLIPLVIEIDQRL